MKSLRFVGLLLCLAIVLACSSVSPTPTAVPTPSPVPSSTPIPPPTEIPPTSTPTLIPATPTPKVQQFFTEYFPDEHSDNWFYFLRYGKDEDFSLTGLPDGLLFELTGTGTYSYLVYDPFEYEEVRIDATVENQGVNDNNVTLFCRYSPEGGWYELNVYSSGLYDMYFTKPDSAGNLNYGLIAEGGSKKINMGHAVNKYTLICKKDSLSVFINDIETRTVGLPTYVLQNGKIGISVSSFGQVPVKVLVKELKISQP